MVIDSVTELIILQRALTTLRFGNCNNDEITHLACSPHLGEMMLKISNELSHYHKTHLPNYKAEWGNIEDYPIYIDAIRNHFNNIEKWNNIDVSTKEEVIKTLAFPFNISAKTIEYLILC